MLRLGLLALIGAIFLLTAIVGQRDTSPAFAAGAVISISAGFEHTCVVVADGGVKCWGNNEAGQLGDGTNNSSDTPVDVCVSGSGIGCSGGERLVGVIEVAAGFSHTCARTIDDRALCWGSNGRGRLGDGTTSERSLASLVCASGAGPNCDPLVGVEQIDVGSSFSCALMSNTGIKCWGSDEVGQLGIGTIDPDAGDVSTAGGFGGHETLPVDVCTRAITPIPLGAFSHAGVVLPVPCLPVLGFTSVATGAEHACGLTEAGGARCWGGVTPLGDGTDEGHGSPVDVCRYLPVLVPLAAEQAGAAECVPVSDFAAIDAGFRHTCALTETGGVRCWGRGSFGRLGDGAEEDRLTPTTVCASGSGFGCGVGTPLSGMEAIAVGSGYSCAISEGGDARCWGTPTGDGTAMARLNPVPVSGLSSGVIEIAGGARATHACAGRDDGVLRCWGSNGHGQLGLGFTDGGSHSTPSTVTGFGPKPAPTSTDTSPPGDTPTPTNTSPPGATATPTPGPGGLIGDVDCSGEVNAIDAAFVLQFVAGLVADLPCPENADANEDGEINTVDAALILQYSAGLLGMLPP